MVMRDLHVEISVGAAVVGVMVTQGSRSPHQGIGVRVLHNSWIPRGELAHSHSVPDVLALVGRHLVEAYSPLPQVETQDKLPLQCVIDSGCDYVCASYGEHETVRLAAWPPAVFDLSDSAQPKDAEA